MLSYPHLLIGLSLHGSTIAPHGPHSFEDWPCVEIVFLRGYEGRQVPCPILLLPISSRLSRIIPLSSSKFAATDPHSFEDCPTAGAKCQPYYRDRQQAAHPVLLVFSASIWLFSLHLHSSDCDRCVLIFSSIHCCRITSDTCTLISLCGSKEK